MEQNIKNVQEESTEMQEKQKIEEIREKIRKDIEMSYKIFMEDIMGVKNEEEKISEKTQEQKEKVSEEGNNMNVKNENEEKIKGGVVWKEIKIL